MMGYMLLPFTHGIDNAAIEQAVSLAHDHSAILVPLAIICVSGRQNSARLEHVQQAKDFLVLVQQKASKAGVPVEAMERYTCEEVEVIQEVALKLECIGTLVFARQQKGVLLSANTIQRLMQGRKRPCFLSSLPAQSTIITRAQWPFRKRAQVGTLSSMYEKMYVSQQMRSVIEV